MMGKLEAQVSSAQYRDASGSGPYPIYIGIAWVNSLGQNEYRDVSNGLEQSSGEISKKNLRGLQALLGVSIKSEDSDLPTIALEFRYMNMVRKGNIGDFRFRMATNQYIIGLGARRAIFPLVVQASVGLIFLYSEELTLDSLSSRLELKRLFSRKKGIYGINGIIRISILDTAGTGGGFGLFAEFGLNFIPKPNNNNLNDLVRIVNPTSPNLPRRKCLGYFSAGLQFPIAIAIK